MTKQAKLASQARLPEPASPAATPTRFDSAMPTLKKRSGNFLAKCSVRVELCTSPSTTTRSAYWAPACARASPNASRVDLPGFMTPSPNLTDLRQGLLGFVGGQRLAVMVRVAAQEMLDRVSLHRAGNDDAGPALGLPRLVEGAEDVPQRWAVAFLG